MGHEDHIRSSQSIVVRCAIITLSDTRDEYTDKSGDLIKRLIAEHEHVQTHYEILPDDPQRLDALLTDLIARPDVDAILTNGGTGISRRDHTFPVIEKHFTSVLPGFGELFRMLSYEQVGSSALLSRAAGGIAGDTLLFSMPGSTKAVELAMTRLILPELKHLLSELRK